MTTTPTFFLLPLPRVRRTLRRTQMLRNGYRCRSVTPVLGVPIFRHEGSVVLDDVGQAVADHTRVAPAELHAGVPSELWPARCANPGCPVEGGYAFQDGDPQALLLDRLYRREDGLPGEYVLSGSLPPGAVFDVAPWAPAGPDGRSLVVVVPDGTLWYLDAPGPDGAVFSRIGPPGGLTVGQVAGPEPAWDLTDGVLAARP